jgi:uncharacterized protein (TIGR01777 family)
VPIFERRSRLAAPTAEVFAWHTRPGAFERLVPPWERVRVLSREGGIRDGGRTVLEIRRGPLRLRWVAEHRDYDEGRRFVDQQVEGPFAAWRHTHEVAADGPDGCVLTDRIEYRLPLGPIGSLAGGRRAERALARAFRFRHDRIRGDLVRHRAIVAGPQRIAVTGASGLVGRSLAAFLTTGGHRVDPLVRRAPAAGSTEVGWDPARGRIDATALEGVDAVVHLAGESVAGGRWTARRKDAIRRSRVDSTRLLAGALAGLARPPRVLVSASAVGYYGDGGDAPLAEESPPGAGFLAEVARDWEAATAPAAAAGIRVVTLRIGLVVSAAGGAVARMRLPFSLGLGGPIGNGRQYVSWIALDDVVDAIHFLLFAPDVAGPVNAVAPEAVTSRGFARTLGRVLRRPALLPLPGPVVRALFGEMGQALLLEGQRVRPARLLAAGFRFRHPDLERALRAELGAFAGDG